MDLVFSYFGFFSLLRNYDYIRRVPLDQVVSLLKIDLLALYRQINYSLQELSTNRML